MKSNFWWELLDHVGPPLVVLVLSIGLAFGIGAGFAAVFPPTTAPVRGVPECHVMGGMVEWDIAKTHQINRLICIGVEDDYPYAITVDRDEWEKWTAQLGMRWPGE